MEELLGWPWLRVQIFYDQFVLRELVERQECLRDQIIAALHGNSGFEKHDDLSNAIRSIEESFNETVNYLRSQSRGVAREDDGYDPDDPFWVAAERGAAKLDMPIPLVDASDGDATAAEMVDTERDAGEFMRLMEGLDQG